MSSSTIARWLKSVLKSASIDVSIFGAHSVRGASSSTALNVGITTNEILKGVQNQCFRSFIIGALKIQILAEQCSLCLIDLGGHLEKQPREAVDNVIATNNTVDMENWAF